VVPIYQVPVEFRRSEALGKAPAREWKAPRPKAVWSVETGAPVWVGLERDAATGMLYVGNERGTLHAITWHIAAGDIMTATPAVYRDSVTLGAFDGKVQAVSAKDGSLELRREVGRGRRRGGGR
jgi:PQQ-like domain